MSVLKTLAITSTLWLASISAAAAEEILFVVGTTPIPSWSGDTTVLNLLQQQGHSVQVVDDAASTTANATGKHLVIVSTSVSPSSVGNKFNQVPVPVIVYKRELFATLGLIAGSANQGYAPTQTQLQMTGTHPLTGGLAGTVTVVSTATDFNWGRPAASAVQAATIVGDTTRAAIFGYESGAQLANSTTAPARRIATYMFLVTPARWTADGRTLFNATVQWALGTQTQTNQAPVVDAGPDKAATAGVPLSLDGVVTDDGAALPLTIAWQPLSGASFADASNPTTSVTFASPGVYVLELRASDPEFSDSDTVTITVGSGSSTGDKQTLFVVGTAPIPTWSGDTMVLHSLQQQGHTVEVVDDDASTTANATGKHLVILSTSVSPSSVGNKFNQVPVPVIVYKRELFARLGLISGSANQGYVQNQTQLQATGAHALAGGLAGTVTVGSAATNFNWGRPAASAVRGATIVGDTTRAAIFGYEAGALLANSATAPARRVATYYFLTTAAKWTADGQILFNAAVQWALNEPPPSPRVRILPLGDSITNGSGGFWSFRRDLAGLLTNAGCTYDMVGTLFGPFSGSPGSGNFDRDHEGHSGYRTDQVLSQLSQWVVGNEPDWVLIHLGTNDVLQGASIPAARANLSAIIDSLRAVNADVGILLAQIIPNQPANEAAVVDLNTAIADLAAAKNTAGSPVILVDQYSGYNTFTHNYDQVHPNASGEAIIAGRWYEALHPQIAAACGN